MNRGGDLAIRVLLSNTRSGEIGRTLHAVSVAKPAAPFLCSISGVREDVRVEGAEVVDQLVLDFLRSYSV
jgi:hypothetical protein